MTDFELVQALLRSALTGSDAPEAEWSDGRWEAVYEIAADQGVHTLIFDAFRPGCVPPKPLLARWMMDIERVESVSVKMDAVAEELSRQWKNAGLSFAVLKGRNVASMYPHPDHRLSGDIDFYFPDPEGWRMAWRMAKRMSDVGMDSDRDIHYMWRGIVIEHHRCWNHLSSRAALSLPAGIVDGALCPEDNLLMLSSHILRHAMVGGVGLRQLSDFAAAVRALDGQYDKGLFAQRLSSLGLSRWGGLLSAVMTASFGVSPEVLPVEADSEFVADFLDLVRRDGNLGKENERLLSGFIPRAELFMKICPREFSARLWSLGTGRARRAFGNIKE